MILKDTATFQVLFIVSWNLEHHYWGDQQWRLPNLKVKSAKCLSLLPVVLVMVLLLRIWSCLHHWWWPVGDADCKRCSLFCLSNTVEMALRTCLWTSPPRGRRLWQFHRHPHAHKHTHDTQMNRLRRVTPTTEVTNRIITEWRDVYRAWIAHQSCFVSVLLCAGLVTPRGRS